MYLGSPVDQPAREMPLRTSSRQFAHLRVRIDSNSQQLTQNLRRLRRPIPPFSRRLPHTSELNPESGLSCTHGVRAGMVWCCESVRVIFQYLVVAVRCCHTLAGRVVGASKVATCIPRCKRCRCVFCLALSKYGEIHLISLVLSLQCVIGRARLSCTAIRIVTRN